MSLVLIGKAAYEDRWIVAIILPGLILFPLLILLAFTSFPWETMQQLIRTPIIATLIEMLTGFDVTQGITITAVCGFAFVHPVVLTVAWGYVVVGTSRALAGEVDNGTADLLLALPVSRLRVYASATFWTMLVCPLLSAAVWGGVAIGSRLYDLPQPVDVWLFRLVAVNHACMLLAVSGIGAFVSALSSRRSRAVGVVVGVLVTTFFVNWLAAAWSPAQPLAYLSLLRYVNLMRIFSEQSIPAGHVAVLLATAATFWLAGAFAFTRRDIHTA